MKTYYEEYLYSIVPNSVVPLTEKEFYEDCESICFECGRKFGLKKIHDGVALCLWHRIKEFVFGY